MITVAYICPSFLPQYAGKIARFVASYVRHPDVLKHEFVLVLKGSSELPVYCAGLGMKVLRHTNDGMDCGSYQILAQTYEDREAICFLGTNSMLVDDRWLTKLSSSLLEGNATIAGASGSYESGVSGRLYNPHIRSTGFMMRPRDLLEMYPEPVVYRQDCIEFESGADNLTHRILQRGGECVVVGRDGRRFGLESWGSMGGFRQGDQSNLLIWDNHADTFARYSDGDKEFINRQTFPPAS